MRQPVSDRNIGEREMQRERQTRALTPTKSTPAHAREPAARPAPPQRLDAQGDERAHRHPAVDAGQGRARPPDADLRQAAAAEPAAEHPHVGAVRRGRWRRRRAGHRAPQHRPARRRDSRQHAQLRLLLPVPGTAPQTHDPGADAHPRAERRGVRRARPPSGRGIHLRARGPRRDAHRVLRPDRARGR